MRLSVKHTEQEISSTIAAARRTQWMVFAVATTLYCALVGMVDGPVTVLGVTVTINQNPNALPFALVCGQALHLAYVEDAVETLERARRGARFPRTEWIVAVDNDPARVAIAFLITGPVFVLHTNLALSSPDLWLRSMAFGWYMLGTILSSLLLAKALRAHVAIRTLRRSIVP